MVSKFFHIISGIFLSTLVSSVSLIRPLLAPKKGGKPLLRGFGILSCTLNFYCTRSFNIIHGFIWKWFSILGKLKHGKRGHKCSLNTLALVFFVFFSFSKLSKFWLIDCNFGFWAITRTVFDLALCHLRKKTLNF